MELKRTSLSVRAEQAILVAVVLPADDTIGEPLEELSDLARTAGSRIVGKLVQKRGTVDPAACLGKGKLEELKELCVSTDADVVIFDRELKPGQVQKLEKTTGLKVVDRTELILDIFATRAQTKQARLQVELAQLEYALPRLRKMWSHLSRVEGGIGMRGPGEQQLETDRRLARRRITDLKRSLKEIESRRERQVKSRSGRVNICMVGYTNAGKSTLMNRLTNSTFLVEDRLFATLDTRTRKWKTRNSGEVLLSDTVGFIKNLPHDLVASFHATLEEVQSADVLLHVVDASTESPFAQIEAVNSVLKEMKCVGKETILVFNKMDKARESVELATAGGYGNAGVFISAANGSGIDSLESAIEDAINGFTRKVCINAHPSNQNVVSFIKETGGLISVGHDEGKLKVKARLRTEDIERIAANRETEVVYI